VSRAIAISPSRTTRVEELWLLWHFAGTIRLNWRMLVEPLDTLEMVTDVAGPMMSKKIKAELSVELSEARACDDSRPAEPDALQASAAMLFAATNWICRLEFPRRAEDLWAEPPLADRTTYWP
jgi:hypothetical protein